MDETSRAKQPAFYLYSMDAEQLVDICAEVDIDVLPLAQEGDFLFYLLGDPTDVQRLLNAVKTRTGIVKVYPNLDLAQAAKN
jgi:hypothetical protein